MRCSLPNLLRPLLFLSALACAPLFAGPPLICHPYEIGTAQSLPVGKDGWTNPSYDRSRVVEDTLGLLTPELPIIVRMETLRRAAVYATSNLKNWGKGYTEEERKLAIGLLEKLRERSAAASEKQRAIALFDLGFYSETLRQTGMDPALDGYAFIVKAVELRGGQDAEMEFALALASVRPQRPDQTLHLEKARNGATKNPLLAANLASHFGKS